MPPGPTRYRALVTGAGGFVGANLTRALVERGHEVAVLVRQQTDPWRLADVLPELERHEADLTDSDAVARVVDATRPNVIFHLAKHRGNPAQLDYTAALRNNVHATLHMLEAAAARGVRRFVHAGSSLEYDLARSPLREADAPAPSTVHGVTKAAASLLCQHFARVRDVPAVVLRLFTVYGPWEGRARFVPTLMRAALEGDRLRVTDEALCHDWIHVDDVVEACVRAAEAPDVSGEIINIATGVQSTNETLVEMVEALTGQSIPRANAFPARPWDTTQWVADVTKARRCLQWQAAIPLRDGLARTHEWFGRHSAHYARHVV